MPSLFSNLMSDWQNGPPEKPRGLLDTLGFGEDDPNSYARMAMLGNMFSVGEPVSFMRGVPEAAAMGHNIQRQKQQDIFAQQEREKEQQTSDAMRAYVSQIVPDNLRTLADADPNMALTIMQQTQPGIKKPIEINGQLVDPDTYEVLGDFRDVQGAGGADEKFALSPIYGTDAEGNPSLVQLSNAGRAQQTPLPEGFGISKDPIRMDAGTHFILLDPVTRQQIGMIPKNNFQEAADKAAGGVYGKTEAENQVNAPQDFAKGQDALDVIYKLKTHTGADDALGWKAHIPTIGGTDKADFNALVEQAQGKVFLEAYQSLRGGGQITEVEGKKAEQAIARLQTTQSPEAFMEALDDLEDVIRRGMERAQGRMTGDQRSRPQSAPAGQTSSGLTWSVE